MRRRVWVVVAVLAALAIGLLTGWWTRGWQGEVARPAAPSPTRVTALVEQGVLDDALLVAAEWSQTVVGKLRGNGIVTVVPASGTTVREGDAPFEFTLTKQFVLQGARPMVRELRAGVTGPDVAQLNAALARLGYPAPAKSATFEPSTGAAWTALLRAKGAPVPAGEPVVGPTQVAFAPTLPATIADVKLTVGDQAGGEVASLLSNTPTLRVTLSPEQAGIAPKEPVVSLINPVDQSLLPVKVTGRQPDQSGGVVYTVPGSVPAEWRNLPLRARVGSTPDSQPGLLVPRAALAMQGASQADVRLLRSSGGIDTVPVTVTGFDRQFAKVTGALTAGDVLVLAG